MRSRRSLLIIIFLLFNLFGFWTFLSIIVINKSSSSKVEDKTEIVTNQVESPKEEQPKEENKKVEPKKEIEKTNTQQSNKEENKEDQNINVINKQDNSDDSSEYSSLFPDMNIKEIDNEEFKGFKADIRGENPIYHVFYADCKVLQKADELFFEQIGPNPGYQKIINENNHKYYQFSNNNIAMGIIIKDNKFLFVKGENTEIIDEVAEKLEMN